MPNRTVLITGASGEIGQALIKSLSGNEFTTLVTVDLKELPEELSGKSKHFVGNLLNKDLLSALEEEYNFNMIYHLAAVLSTNAEHDPLLAPPSQHLQHDRFTGDSRPSIKRTISTSEVSFSQFNCSLWAT